MSSVVATLVTFAASSLDKVELFVVVYAELFPFFTYINQSKSKANQSKSINRKIVKRDYLITSTS